MTAIAGADRLAGLIVLLLASAAPLSAQEVADDSIQLLLRSTLRAFYFDLGHHDWEALSSHILPAKVVAHRQAPSSLSAGRAPFSSACAPADTPLVEQATIVRDGEWAEAAVPRCDVAGTDGFRFVHFGPRWWIVHTELAGHSGELRLAR